MPTEIAGDGSNVDTLPGSAHMISRVDPQRTCFIVGAGASVSAPTKLPTALQFLQPIRDQILESVPEWLLKSIEANSHVRISDFAGFFGNELWNGSRSVWSRLRFETILHVLRLSGFDESLDLLSVYGDDRQPNEMHMLLAACLGTGSNILTTNFDTMIEKASLEVDYDYLSGADAIERYTQKTHAKPMVVKLHGTLPAPTSDQSGQIVADLSTIPLYVSPLVLPSMTSDRRLEVIRNATEGRVVIVLGYSAGDDFDILPLLAQASSGFERVIWIQHHNLGVETRTIPIDPMSARAQILEHDSFRHAWTDAFNQIPITVVQGETRYVVSQLFPLQVQISLERAASSNHPPQEEAPQSTAKYLRLAQKSGVDWAFLIGCFFSFAHEEALACITFATCFNRYVRAPPTTLYLPFIRECYARSCWHWDYLWMAPIYRLTSISLEKLEAMHFSPPPPGLPAEQYEIARSAYHQLPVTAAGFSRDRLNIPQDTQIEARLDLMQDLLDIEEEIETTARAYTADLAGRVEHVIDGLAKSGDVNSMCRALLAFAKADKRTLRFDRAAASLISCITWARSVGDHKTYTQAYFELSLIEPFLQEKSGWESLANLCVPFATPQMPWEITSSTASAFNGIWMTYSDSFTWFYGTVLQAALPSNLRTVPVEQLLKSLLDALDQSIKMTRYNRAGLLCGLALLPWLEGANLLEETQILATRLREHASELEYIFIVAVIDFFMHQDPEYLNPFMWNPLAAKDAQLRQTLFAYAIEDIKNLRTHDFPETGIGNLIRLL